MTVRIDQSALDRYLRGPDVRRTMQRAVDTGAKAAKLYVGYSRPDPLGRPRKYPTHLRDAIYGRVEVRGGKIVGVIGARHPIAKMHHDGTRPHVIRARNKPLLVFADRRSGMVYRVKQVYHPGTRPNKYLTKALGDVGRSFR